MQNNKKPGRPAHVEAPPKISEAQFDALADVMRLRKGSDCFAAVYRVLVNGESITTASEAVGVGYNPVYQAVRNATAGLKKCKVAAGVALIQS